MSSVVELPVDRPFRPECASWLGYQPCDYQKTDNIKDCSSCPFYNPTEDPTNYTEVNFDPAVLSELGQIGIVEMGGLGSILRTTAITHYIRKVNPDARISWFTNQRGADLLRYVPAVQPIDVEGGDFYPQIAGQMDLVINFESNDYARSIVERAKAVAGFAVSSSGKFYPTATAGELQRLQIDDDFRRSLHKTFQEVLLGSIGVRWFKPQYDIELRVHNLESALNILDESFQRRFDNYLGINIGTSPKGTPRRWPLTSFVRLATELAKLYPDNGIAVMSGPDDNNEHDQFIGLLPHELENVAVLSNNLEVGDFMASVALMDILITSDTFAFHVARSMSTPVITFAGPNPIAELEVGRNDTVLSARRAFTPCMGHCTHAEIGECIKIIDVESVMSVVSAHYVIDQESEMAVV